MIENRKYERYETHCTGLFTTADKPPIVVDLINISNNGVLLHSRINPRVKVSEKVRLIFFDRETETLCVIIGSVVRLNQREDNQYEYALTYEVNENVSHMTALLADKSKIELSFVS